MLSTLCLPAYDLPAARSLIEAAIAEANLPVGDLVINLTGGTKLMSLAAMQAAYGQGVPLMYVSTEQNLILTYSSDGFEIRRQGINVKITVKRVSENLLKGGLSSKPLTYGRTEQTEIVSHRPNRCRMATDRTVPSQT